MNLRFGKIKDHTIRVSGKKLRKIIVGNLKNADDDWPPVDQEGIWAQDLGGGIFRIDNIPFFARTFSLGDDVKAERAKDGRFYISAIEKHHGHSTYRVLISDDETGQNHGNLEALIDNLKLYGAELEIGSSKFFSIDVPPDAHIHAVYDLLEAGLEFGVWDFEEAFNFRAEAQVETLTLPHDVGPM